MRFQRIIALIAVVGLAAHAHAQETAEPQGSQVQIEVATPGTAPAPVAAPAVTAPAVSSVQATAPTAISTKVIVYPNSQPSTVVEAAPMTESKAQRIRKSRQSEELRTEQMIAEKLEEERLREEQERVNRLFGKKNDVKSIEQQTVSAPAEEAVPAVSPAKVNAVISEKLEIVQPSASPSSQALMAPVLVPVQAPASAEPVDATESARRLEYGTFVAVPSYSASNIRSNFGLGFNVSTMIAPEWALEGSFMYSNYFVDTFWRYGLFSEMNQYDLNATTKYYWQFGSIRPYLGVTSGIVFRTYTDRVKQGVYWNANPNTDQESTYSMVLGAVAGAEMQVSRSVVISAGIEYLHPIMNQSNFDYSSFSMAPGDSRAVEDFDYMVLKFGGRISF